jgi:virulence factor Mce-like protein
MNRRPTSSLLASPVLVGAVTTLIVIVAVFLAYNANTGLPFVPTRELKIEFPGGQELVKGDEVREGGYRIGVVNKVQPLTLSDGTVGAVAILKLDSAAGAFPVDSSAVIRPRSALGLEYVDLNRGHSSRLIKDGGTLPVAQNSQETELDQVFGIFDQPTRQAVQTNLTEFGNALAARGADLSSTIQELPPTLRVLTPVAHNLASPATDLRSFFPSLERTAGAIAPFSGLFARTFTTMADTFAAISANPDALRATISKSPGTLAVGTTSLRIQTPFLRDTAAAMGDLDAATAELRGALPTLNSALRVGIPVTRRSQGLYTNLTGALGSLRDLTTAPTTPASLRGLTATVTTLQPQLRYLGPFVTVCNYWNTFWTFLSEHLSANTATGTAERAINDLPTLQNNTYGSMGAAIPANGESILLGNPMFFHGAPYGHAVDASGNADCTFGQNGQIHRAFRYGPSRFNIDIDPKALDWLGHPLGPTYATYANASGGGQGVGPTHVPLGETFTATPGGTAAQVPFSATASVP